MPARKANVRNNAHQDAITMFAALAFFVLSIMFSGCVAFAKAQAVSNAKIHGVVTDTSGAVIPNVTGDPKFKAELVPLPGTEARFFRFRVGNCLGHLDAQPRIFPRLL